MIPHPTHTNLLIRMDRELSTALVGQWTVSHPSIIIETWSKQII